jgi:hypothetical protein
MHHSSCGALPIAPFSFPRSYPCTQGVSFPRSAGSVGLRSQGYRPGWRSMDEGCEGQVKASTPSFAILAFDERIRIRISARPCRRSHRSPTPRRRPRCRIRTAGSTQLCRAGKGVLHAVPTINAYRGSPEKACRSAESRSSAACGSGPFSAAASASSNCCGVAMPTRIVPIAG